MDATASQPMSRVLVDASKPITGRSTTLPMLVEFNHGRPFKINRGRNEFNLRPGRYHVRLYSLGTPFRVGKAELIVDARPGHTALVHYAAPLTLFTRGRAGHGPLARRRPGIGAYFIIAAVAMLVPLVVIAAIIIADALSH